MDRKIINKKIVIDNYSGIDKKDYHQEAEEESLNDSKKSFMNNRLSVTLKVNDLFNNRKFIIDTVQDYTDYTLKMYAERKRGRRTTSINLRYNFGKQQKKKWDRRNFSGRGGGGGGMDMDY